MTLTPFHIIIVLILGVLFFGKNLPGVARQVGSALLELRKGLNEWKEDYGRSTGVGERTDVSRSVCGAKEETGECFEPLGTRFVPPSDG